MDLLAFTLALLPIAWLVVALSALKIKGHVACVSSFCIAFALAIAYWRLNPYFAATAALEGLLNALWPICLVVIAALFTYNLLVHTQAMEAIKAMLASVSKDKRMLALLIGWGFGLFMEGMAGFGTAVAIPASMLVGIGFNPISAVVGCLVVNAMPTAFGSVGVPSLTLGSITGLDMGSLCSNIALLEAIPFFFAPFFLVCICGGGIKALKGMIPTITLASISFLIPWILVANFVGPELPDVMGAACSMACILVCAKRKSGQPIDPRYAIEREGGTLQITKKEGLRAWAPFILVFALLTLTSSLVPPIHDVLATIKTPVQVYAGDNPATLTFSWINTPGVIILIAAFIGGLIQGARISEMVAVLGKTFAAYWRALLTICSVMAMAKVMGYSGMISAIATVLIAVAGPFYPFMSPIVGALGGFVTGSGTSTNVLFGGLQSQTAQGLGLNQAWICAGNAAGAGIGKMVCPQSIAIGTSATGTVGQESVILKKVSGYFALYVLMNALICFAGSFFL